MRFGEEANVSGTVLISDGVLPGADIPGKENPYAQFRSIQPAEVIDHGVYVYRGQFRLGAAAALEHVGAARDFAKQHNAAGTVREAQIAVNLDPDNPQAHALLGDALAATGETRAAQSEYAAALHSSELDPAFQKNLLAELLAKTEPLNWLTVRQERRRMDPAPRWQEATRQCPNHSPTMMTELSVSALSPMHSSTTITTNTSLRVRPIALVDVAVNPASPGRKAGHGNDRVWKAWKAMKPASHPSHTLWKSLRDSHIPTASTTGYMSSHAPSTRTIATARGL